MLFTVEGTTPTKERHHDHSGEVHRPSREEFSERLLKGSVKKSYAPIVDIDWDARSTRTSSTCRPRPYRCTAPRCGIR
ncbi:hypothetical protein I553_4365 [Mycobacterium xenopi 4042]|uniref:Uncharacterized protein n=1 Tax=Mycobacterium xenopi 4042 TaxID=1299334 RepID=X8AF06_MYCXE|nr:hypothetical protein I553_4365 [Mycobacterium xenopi 4042]